jgi:hypothetical protein
VDSLEADGNRLIWVALDGGRGRVHTWKVGDKRPQAVPEAVYLDNDTGGGIEAAVSGDRVAWYIQVANDHEPIRTTVRTWAAGQHSATTLASYPFRPKGLTVTRPSVSGDRVAWVVAREYDFIPQLEGDSALVTWKVGDHKPTSVATHLPASWISLPPTVSGDRIAFLANTGQLNDTVYMAELNGSPVPDAADETSSAATTPNAAEAGSADGTQEKNAGVRAWDVVLGFAALAGILGIGTWWVVARRRKKE